MNISCNWLKDYINVPSNINVLAHELTMCGLEIKKILTAKEYNDTVLEAEITSNRPDWLGYVGVAREIGAITGERIKYPEEKIKQKREKNNKINNVDIKNLYYCPFYTAVLLEDVENKETPKFIKDRLMSIGVRSVNLPVDISNYVLFEYNQPLHTFDYDKIADSIIVRQANKGEKFQAINSKVYELDNNDLVICDEKGPIAIAGIMGGLQSEVSFNTKNILLESAFFNPVAIRKTSRKLQLVSESSYRFERGVDPEGVIKASNRFIYLLSKYGKIGKISLIIKSGSLTHKKRKISLSFDYVQKVLGMTVPKRKIIEIIKKLDLNVYSIKDDNIVVQIPTFRNDLERPIDLVEEVARIYGYDRIPETYPLISMSKNKLEKSLKCEDLFREYGIAVGASEIITYNLVNPKFYEKFSNDILVKCINITNPSNKELTLMRPSLITGTLDVIKSNVNHSYKNLKIFEVGRIYFKSKNNKLPNEEKRFSISITGEAFNNWLDHKRIVNLFDLKGMIEDILEKINISNISYSPMKSSMLTNGIQILLNSKNIGYIGKVTPDVIEHFDIGQDVFYAEISIDKLLEDVSFDNKYKGFSKYPYSYRDLSIVIDETIKANDITKAIRSSGGTLIKGLMLYDHYKGKQIPNGFKSLTFSIEYQADDRTLSHDDVELTHDRIISVLQNKFNAKLRQ